MGSHGETVRDLADRGFELEVNKIPPELLILTRIGIAYSHLLLAWKMSQRDGREPSDILIERGLLTVSDWGYSQKLLAKERRHAYLVAKQKRHLLKQAITNLSTYLPHYSARQTCDNAQLYRYSVYAMILTICMMISFATTVEVICYSLMVFYSAVILLRAFMLASFRTRHKRNHKNDLTIVEDIELPIYTVLVALYKEKHQIKSLTKHLYQLDWPKDKLDIKLICEADDRQTIAEILDCKLPSCFELITVPTAEPRTKPKALNYALPLARGEFIALYDAEDKPVPLQLQEAYSRFRLEGNKLACLQAPLYIHNMSQNWLTAMFAIEYMTLFDGILPVLAKWRVPIPLGGTSNHFRASVLKDIGGWDPYNVTEDADLGIRVFREGFYTSTIRSPTFEEAPPHLGIWIKQRTRWQKGWMQTLLVHNRNPVAFIRDMGWRNTIAYHLVLTALVTSSLLHPLLLLAFFVKILGLAGTLTLPFDGVIVATSAFNLVGGYTTYSLLALIVLQFSKMHRLAILIPLLPIYWLLVSYASWRALFYLIANPHHWEKTEHGLAKDEFHITK